MIARALAAVALCIAASLGAQVPASPPNAPGRLVGRVLVDGTAIPLSYAVVAIPALGIERFTDAAGGYSIGGVPTGTHRVRVRHVGYEPRDTTVSVPAGASSEPLVVGLRRLAVQLATVRVRARRECSRPGPPDARMDPVAAALFEQVQQNAERARLLAEQYPYVYRMERSFGDPAADGQYRFTPADTLLISSVRTWRYRPGDLLRPDSVRRGEWVVHLPTLQDVADSVFLATHCFDYVGLDTLFGHTMARVNVMPARAIRSADVQGAIYLDSATFQIRWTDFAVTQMTEMASRVRFVRDLRIATQFQEVLPALPIVSGIRAVTTSQRNNRVRPVESVEMQFLLGFEWTGTPP